MTEIGTVLSCWRYPVKSMQGLSVTELVLESHGALGDRTHGLLDVEAQRLLSAKRLGALLGASATDEAITLPDGTEVGLDDPEASARLSEWLDREVRLVQPDDVEPGLAYQMTFDPPNDDAELFDIPMPPGTFLDLGSVHVITTATLEGCALARPELDWDVRRFRPNFVIAADGEAFAEQQWQGRRLQLGEVVVIDGIFPTVRCAMPLRAQPGLDRQPGLFRAMSDLNAALPNYLGVYASVATTGTVRVGDPVCLLDD